MSWLYSFWRLSNVQIEREEESLRLLTFSYPHSASPRVASLAPVCPRAQFRCGHFIGLLAVRPCNIRFVHGVNWLDASTDLLHYFRFITLKAMTMPTTSAKQATFPSMLLPLTALSSCGTLMEETYDACPPKPRVPRGAALPIVRDISHFSTLQHKSLL